jgi:hypothetical protein
LKPDRGPPLFNIEQCGQFGRFLTRAIPRQEVLGPELANESVEIFSGKRAAKPVLIALLNNRQRSLAIELLADEVLFFLDIEDLLSGRILNDKTRRFPPTDLRDNFKIGT